MQKHYWTALVWNWKTSFLNLNIHVVNDFTDFDECSLEPSPCDDIKKTIHFAFILSYKTRRYYFFSTASCIVESFFHHSTIKIQALFICGMHLFNEHSQPKQNTGIKCQFFMMQLQANFSTTATLRREFTGHCGEKEEIVGRWLLVQVRSYSIFTYRIFSAAIQHSQRHLSILDPVVQSIDNGTNY